MSTIVTCKISVQTLDALRSIVERDAKIGRLAWDALMDRADRDLESIRALEAEKQQRDLVRREFNI